MSESKYKETGNLSLESDGDVYIDDAFSYDGYEVVRGEFFAHVFEPSFVLSGYKVSVNTACIKKLPDTEYIQILVNPEEKKLAVLLCLEKKEITQLDKMWSRDHMFNPEAPFQPGSSLFVYY